MYLFHISLSLCSSVPSTTHGHAIKPDSTNERSDDIRPSFLLSPILMESSYTFPLTPLHPVHDQNSYPLGLSYNKSRRNSIPSFTFNTSYNLCHLSHHSNYLSSTCTYCILHSQLTDYCTTFWFPLVINSESKLHSWNYLIRVDRKIYLIGTANTAVSSQQIEKANPDFVLDILI
jgi:hypothetical protein